MQRTGAEDLFGLFDGVSCDVVDSESRDLKILFQVRLYQRLMSCICVGMLKSNEIGCKNLVWRVQA